MSQATTNASPQSNFTARFGARRGNVPNSAESTPSQGRQMTRRSDAASDDESPERTNQPTTGRNAFLARRSGAAAPAQAREEVRGDNSTMTRETLDAFDRVLDMVRANSPNSSRPLLLIVEELHKFNEKKGLGVAGKRCVAIRDSVLHNLAKGMKVDGEDALTTLDRLSKKAIDLTENTKYDATFMMALADYISTVIEKNPDLIKPYVRSGNGFKRGEKGRTTYTSKQLAEEFISENLKPTRINNYFGARLTAKKPNTIRDLKEAIAANKETDVYRHREGYRSLVKFITETNEPALTIANVDVILRAAIKPFSRTEFKETAENTRYPSTSYRLRTNGVFTGLAAHRWKDDKGTEHQFAADGRDHAIVALHEYSHLVKFLFDKIDPVPVSPTDVAYAILADIPETQKTDEERANGN
jgi:hypothetical protein